MATYEKLLLSESTDGKGIVLSGSSTPGTAIHTAHATALDEVWLYAVNSSSIDVKLTVEWGQADAPDGNIEQTLEGESGLVLVIPGLILTNSLVIKAFAGTASVIIVHGFVNRISS